MAVDVGETRCQGTTPFSIPRTLNGFHGVDEKQLCDSCLEIVTALSEGDVIFGTTKLRSWNENDIFDEFCAQCNNCAAGVQSDYERRILWKNLTNTSSSDRKDEMANETHFKRVAGGSSTTESPVERKGDHARLTICDNLEPYVIHSDDIVRFAKDVVSKVVSQAKSRYLLEVLHVDEEVRHDDPEAACRRARGTWEDEQEQEQRKQHGAYAELCPSDLGVSEGSLKQALGRGEFDELAQQKCRRYPPWELFETSSTDFAEAYSSTERGYLCANLLECCIETDLQGKAVPVRNGDAGNFVLPEGSVLLGGWFNVNQTSCNSTCQQEKCGNSFVKLYDVANSPEAWEQAAVGIGWVRTRNWSTPTSAANILPHCAGESHVAKALDCWVRSSGSCEEEVCYEDDFDNAENIPDFISEKNAGDVCVSHRNSFKCDDAFVRNSLLFEKDDAFPEVECTLATFGKSSPVYRRTQSESQVPERRQWLQGGLCHASQFPEFEPMNVASKRRSTSCPVVTEVSSTIGINRIVFVGHREISVLCHFHWSAFSRHGRVTQKFEIT